MNILFCVNDAYMPKLAATLCSFWESNVRNFNRVHIYIRATDISYVSREELMRIAEKYGFERRRINFVDASELNDQLTDLGIAKFKGNYLAYHKIFGLDSIGAEGRLLVLDADLMIRKDLRPLYNTDLGSCPIGGVCEYPTALNTHGKRNSQEYNGGVWLVDLDLYKEKQVQEKLIDYIHAMPDDWATGEQTLISLALGRSGMICRLPLKYNFLLNYFAYKPDDFYYIHHIQDGFYSKNEFIKAQKEPAIVHLILGLFVIPPWFALGTEPIKSKWRAYLADTKWNRSYTETLNRRWILQVYILKFLKMVLPHSIYVILMKKMASYTKNERSFRK